MSNFSSNSPLSSFSKPIAKKKYSVISDDLRKNFINRIYSNKAADEFNLKFSTAKSILRTFRNEGRIGKKKTRNMNKPNLQQEDFKTVKTTNIGYFGQIPSQIGSTSEIFQRNDYAGQFLPKFENLFQMCQVKNSLENLFESHQNQVQYNEKLLNWLRQQQIAKFNVKANLVGNLWRQAIMEELMKGNLT